MSVALFGMRRQSHSKQCNRHTPTRT